jgi:hypothetical protein
MKKYRYIFFIILLLFILFYTYNSFNKSTFTGKAPIFKHHNDEPPPLSAHPETYELSQLTDFLSKRCNSEGIRFKVINTNSSPLLIPNAFHAEGGSTWPKVIGKLEARYGVVPVYDTEDPQFLNPPTSVIMVGRFLYFGKNPKEIDALKLLSDGDAAKRSQALDNFEDMGSHAIPLLLALQARDEDAQIRMEATQRLQFFDSARVIDATISALGDNDEAVQAAARSTLVWIGNERVLQAVRMAAKNTNPRISEMALSILQDNLER